MVIDILGKRYRVRHCNRLGNRGDCDPPNTPAKEIRIANGLSAFEHLEVSIHEFKHADDFHKFDEGYVTRFSKDLARFLWRLGYRRYGTQGPNLRNQDQAA